VKKVAMERGGYVNPNAAKEALDVGRVYENVTCPVSLRFSLKKEKFVLAFEREKRLR